MENTKKKLVVYTCITNDYDTLREIPRKVFDSISDSVSFICFTDNPELYSDSKTWTIREMPEDLAKLSKVKAQRVLKIVPFRYVDDISDISLWVDSNLAITESPLDLLSKCDLKKFPLWTFKHPQRNCIYDEELAVVRLKKEKLDIATAQIEKYMKDRYPIKNGLAETNMILRRHDDPLMRKMSYLWAKEVIDGSHRDQLSFNYACWKTGLKYGEFDKKVTDKIITRLAHKSPEKLKEDEERKKREEEEKKSREQELKDREETIRKLTEEKKNLEVEKNKQKEYPIVSVVMTTHNRTRIAMAVIDSFCKNLEYKGKIKWIISDDRSYNNHTKLLVKQFENNGISNVTVLKSDSERFGLGAAMNRGLNTAFDFGDIVLTTEDDWILEKKLDITDYVQFLMSDTSVGMIRLAATGKCDRKKYKNSEFDKLSYENRYGSIMNMQVALRHKRLYKNLGMYPENCSTDAVENDMSRRYNRLTTNGNANFLNILIPSCIAHGTLDDPSLYFIHVGKSTVNHGYSVPERYEYLYSDRFFDVIIPVKNAGPFLKRAVDSILSQQFQNFHIIIVDDGSTDNTPEVIQKLVNEYQSKITAIRNLNSLGGGGARNKGIDLSISEYILFLDADDNFSDNTVFQTIYNTIIENNFPDSVKLSFTIESSNGIDNRIYDNTMDEKKLISYESPWSLCVKRSMCPQFIEHRKRFNDVVWYLRAFDKSKKIATVSTPCVLYHIGENPNSVQYGKKDIAWYAAIPQLIGDLMAEKFEKSVVKMKVKEIMKNKEKELSYLLWRK